MKHKNKIAGLFIALIFCLSYSIDYISYKMGPNSYSMDPDNISPDLIWGLLGEKVQRVILISLDSCNPDYIRPDIMPHLWEFMFYTGCMFINAETILSSDTVSGHTSMLTGAFPNTTKIFGNQYANVSLWFHPFPGFMAPHKFFDYDIRQAKTIIEALEPDLKIGTHFISSKWLHWMLAWESDSWVGPEYKIEFSQGAPRYLPASSYSWANPNYQSQVGNGYGEMLPMDHWTINALIESLRNEKFPQNFYFVNIGYTDETGHVYGARNAMAERQLREVDNLLHRLFLEIISLGKFFSTLFVITSDHGMETIHDEGVNLQALLEGAGIPCYIHHEGGSAYIGLPFLENKTAGYNKTKEFTLKYLELINSRYWLFDAIVPSENFSDYNLPTDGAAGDIFLSFRKGARIRTNTIPAHANGDHGSINEQKIVMIWMGPDIKQRGIIFNEDPVSICDIVPTIGNITGWDISECSVDGRILEELFN
ncbi:MAG: alkaline phosphatase family protein [Candidatus Helarchaeota archaeon]|nr:alkaline phosphatase family protein [Candidatus Helarchaeota archaeon]